MYGTIAVILLVIGYVLFACKMNKMFLLVNCIASVFFIKHGLILHDNPIIIANSLIAIILGYSFLK